MTVVMKRHPRRAMWLGRLGDYGPPLMCLGLAVISGLQGSWTEVPPWLLAGIFALIYQRRLARVWAWGWREGHEEALRRVLPHVRLDRDKLGDLHDALMVEGPTWQQRQDELAQIDHKATMKASMEQLERMWGEKDAPRS